MSTKIMICMVDNVMKNGRIYHKGDKRETVKDEKESSLWKNQETVEARRKEEMAARLAAEDTKSLKKLQDENAKLRMKVKDLEASLQEKKAKKTKEKEVTDGKDNTPAEV